MDVPQPSQTTDRAFVAIGVFLVEIGTDSFENDRSALKIWLHVIVEFANSAHTSTGDWQLGRWERGGVVGVVGVVGNRSGLQRTESAPGRKQNPRHTHLARPFCHPLCLFFRLHLVVISA